MCSLLAVANYELRLMNYDRSLHRELKNSLLFSKKRDQAIKHFFDVFDVGKSFVNC